MKRYTSLDEYKNDNSEFLSQPIVKSFFEGEPENITLLESAFVDGNEEAKKQLDNRFVEHFFYIG